MKNLSIKVTLGLIFLLTGCAHAKFEPIPVESIPVETSTPSIIPPQAVSQAPNVPQIPPQVFPVSPTAPSIPEAVPTRLPLGERLHYTVYWLGIGVLKGELRTGVSTMIEEDPPLVHVNATARSTGLVRRLFSIQDQLSSLMDPQTLLPREFQLSLRHRTQTIQEHLVFNHAQGTATSALNGTSHIAITPDARDLLSAFYYLRTADLREGHPVAADVVANGRTWHLVAAIHRRGKLTLKQGTFDALEIEVKASWLEQYVKHQTIWLWVTTDETHTPLMLRIKMPVIGNLTAILEDRSPSFPPSKEVGKR